MRQSVAIAAAAAAFLLGAACGTDPPPVALADFDDEARDAICDWAVRCRHAPDRATCQRLLDPKDLDTRRAEDAVAAGRLAYDPDAAGRCVAATSANHCLGVPFDDPSCDEMLTGLVGEGGGCTSDFECAGGADCEIAGCGVQCCTGTCGPPLTGEPPPPPELAAIGEPCEQHADCELGAYCETDRTCTRMPDDEGERCLFGCDGGDLYCDIDVLVCRRYGAAGEDCDPTGETAPRCDPAWSYCDGSCQPRPGAGEACDADRVCIASTYCDGGSCAPRGDAGDPCTDSSQCTVTCDSSLGQCVDYRTCTTGS